MNDFLPVSKEDMEKAHIRQLDFIYVTGDAYVDHPSFGVAIISRVLEAHGYSVGIIAQPDWKDDASIRILGSKARLFGQCGKYGFHGKPLLCFQKAQTDRFLHTGRKAVSQTGSCHDRIRESDPPFLQKNTDHHRRDRSESAQACPLRLLVKFL